MTSTYRATINAADGAQEVRMGLTQEDWDDLLDTYEVRNSTHPVGLVERQLKDGSWKKVGEWDVRPREEKAASSTIRHFEDLDAVARANDIIEARQARADRYARTGR